MHLLGEPALEQKEDLLSKGVWKVGAFLIVLSLGFCSMGSFIVLEGDEFPKQQYIIILSYNLIFCLLFGLTLKLFYGLTFAELIQCCSFHETSLIGLFWSMNYVFILLANPFIPNTAQVIMAQSQNVLIALIDYKYIGIQLSLFKWLLVMLNVVGNIIGIISTTNSSDYSKSVIMFWSLVFLMNALASGMASLCSEVLLKLKKNDSEDGKSDLRRIIELNFGSNFYGFLFCFMGAALSYTANHDTATTWDFSIFGKTGILYFFWHGFQFIYLYDRIVSCYRSGECNLQCHVFCFWCVHASHIIYV